jgi:hypothetical protein
MNTKTRAPPTMYPSYKMAQLRYFIVIQALFSLGSHCLIMNDLSYNLNQRDSRVSIGDDVQDWEEG